METPVRVLLTHFAAGYWTDCTSHFGVVSVISISTGDVNICTTKISATNLLVITMMYYKAKPSGMRWGHMMRRNGL